MHKTIKSRWFEFWAAFLIMNIPAFTWWTPAPNNTLVFYRIFPGNWYAIQDYTAGGIRIISIRIQDFNRAAWVAA